MKGNNILFLAKFGLKDGQNISIGNLKKLNIDFQNRIEGWEKNWRLPLYNVIDSLTSRLTNKFNRTLIYIEVYHYNF